MNNLFKQTCAIVVTLTAMAQAYAINPLSGPVKIVQPDGTPLTVTICGNDQRAVYRTIDGHLLLPVSDGTLCYAVAGSNGEPIASDVVATDPEYRDTAAKSLLRTVNHNAIENAYVARLLEADRLEGTVNSQKKIRRKNKITNYPAAGKQKVLVILARFADIDFFREDAKDYITRMLNEKDFSDNGSTGSVRDYFIDNSCGKYEPEMVVYGPVTLPENMEYYGAPSSTGNDIRPAEMIRDACKLLDKEINFKEYDLDDDGSIDNVYLFYPGYSQADGANPNTIWPHAGSAWSKTYSEFDGVKLDHYACSNELDLLSNQPVNIGTFCHEFTHVLGLPDFYATDYSHSQDPDSWSLMSNGGRNNQGRTPPYMSAYERYSLGWLDPIVLTLGESVTLPAIAENKAYILRSNTNSNEFYMFENRQCNGWDKYLPGSGLLVWHIDYDEAVWKSNTVNNEAAHQRVDLVEADGIASSDTRTGDIFPGSSDNRDFTFNTRPAFATWSGARVNNEYLDLYNIDVDENGCVTFNVITAREKLGTIENVETMDISPVGFTAQWSKLPNATHYVMEVYTKTSTVSGVVRTYVPGYHRKIVESTEQVIVDGLQPATTYYFAVRGMGNGKLGDYSAEKQVTTLDKDFRFEVPVTDSPADITNYSFTARWKALEGATGYNLTVYEVTYDDPVTYLNDFADENVTPQGWSATPGCTINKFYGGKAKPAMAMSGDLMIQTPGDTRDVVAASFWCRGLSSAWDDINEVIISGYCGEGEWTEIRRVWPITTATAGDIITLPLEDFFTPVHALRIQFQRPYGSGTLLMDDIEVNHARAETEVLPRYNKKDAASALSMRVDGLKPSTSYRYVVTATDGTMSSAESRPVNVITHDGTSIDTLPVESLSILDVSVAGSIMHISNNSASTANVNIYSASGIEIMNFELKSTELRFVSALQPGLYIVKSGASVVKVVVR